MFSKFKNRLPHPKKVVSPNKLRVNLLVFPLAYAFSYTAVEHILWRSYLGSDSARFHKSTVVAQTFVSLVVDGQFDIALEHHLLSCQPRMNKPLDYRLFKCGGTFFSSNYIAILRDPSPKLHMNQLRVDMIGKSSNSHGAPYPGAFSVSVQNRCRWDIYGYLWVYDRD